MLGLDGHIHRIEQRPASDRTGDAPGRRLVSVSETEEGRAWAEARIKQLTGGDRIRARFMHQDFFEYLPSFKLLVVGNHQPLLHNVDDAAKRRFNIIPFVHKPSVPDRQLEEKLRAEHPAILRWMIDGCLDWQANGLIRPDIVLEATRDYFVDQDSIQQWICEACVCGSSMHDTTSILFASWQAWAKAAGDEPRSMREFKQALERAGFRSVKNTPGAHGKRGFLCIAVMRTAAPDWRDGA